MVTRQGSEFKGGMVIFDAGKGPRSLLWMSCVLLVGVFGPTDGSMKRQRFGWFIFGHGHFKKIQSQLLLKKSG